MKQRSYNGQIVKLWTPGNYRIEVAGDVHESFTGRLGCIRIAARRGKDQTTVTTMTGRFTDQAELVGVLNSLYEMHFPILLVEKMPDR